MQPECGCVCVCECMLKPARMFFDFIFGVGHWIHVCALKTISRKNLAAVTYVALPRDDDSPGVQVCQHLSPTIILD